MPEADAVQVGQRADVVGSEGVSELGAAVRRCDFRESTRLTQLQSRALKALCEGLAQNLSRSLSTHLRASFDCGYASAEQQSYRDVMKKVLDPAYIALMTASADGSCGLVIIDVGLAFSMIDLLLGGDGKPVERLRELTEVEENILESVVGSVCQELTAAWQMPEVNFQFQNAQPLGGLHKVMAPEDRTLMVRFEAVMPEAKGAIQLVVPGAVSNGLLRKLARDAEYEKRQAAGAEGRMRELVADCGFSFDLSFRNMNIPAAEIVRLAPGQVIGLRRSVQQDATATVAGVPMFAARPARAGARRAAQIVEAQTAAGKVQ
jgi:flagellar motor switch protein FliM